MYASQSTLKEQKLNNDLTKVFIPYKSVLEMEALTNLYLLAFNYDDLRILQNFRPSSETLIDIFGVSNNESHSRIIDFFINVTVEKLKPIVMNARKHHGIKRSGNILSNTKSRVSLYLALNRLKMKFLILRSFFDKLRKNNYNISIFEDNNPEKEIDLHSILFEYFFESNMNELDLMLPKKNISTRVKKMAFNSNSLTSDKIINMATFIQTDEINYRIKFIMRNIKSSLFLCKLMFGKMDVLFPFSRPDENQLNIEELMISNDFIPELIPSLS
ncbi:MAG: hypothetical protein GY870_10385, partial [archaeon]|nr:hypothetical protein [archaeon]